MEPFVFRQCVNILKATGRKANSLRRMRNEIALVSDESIYHHAYHYFLKEHLMEYTNDFAHWAGEALEERALAEQLSNIDPYDFKSIIDLRKEFLNVIDRYLERFPEPREVIAGDEFYFNETITIIYPAGVWVKNLAEFLMVLKYINAGSIYFHFYEARIRLGSGIDDFSQWISHSAGKKELAERIRSIDLFMHNIEEIREYIAGVIEEDLKEEMEFTGSGK